MQQLAGGLPLRLFLLPTANIIFPPRQRRQGNHGNGRLNSAGSVRSPLRRFCSPFPHILFFVSISYRIISWRSISLFYYSVPDSTVFIPDELKDPGYSRKIFRKSASYPSASYPSASYPFASLSFRLARFLPAKLGFFFLGSLGAGSVRIAQINSLFRQPGTDIRSRFPPPV